MPSSHIRPAALIALAGVAHAAVYNASLASMATEFPFFPYRTIRNLDGRWAFAWLGSTVSDATTQDPSGIVAPYTVSVPSCFDLMTYPDLQLAGAHGTALYRTSVFVTPGSLARIRFAACGFYCAVWVDGVKVGEHSGNGYSPFWIGGIPPSASPLRTLEVIADNRFNATTAMLHAYDIDWYQYGGIYRSVEWHEMAPVALQHAHVLVRDAVAGAVDVRVHVHDLSETSMHSDVGSPAGAQAARDRSFYAARHQGYNAHALPALPAWVTLSVAFDDGAPVGTYNLTLDAYGAGVLTGLSVPSPRQWSPSATAMHSIAVTLVGSSMGPPASTETLVDRFGLRTVTSCAPYGNATAVVCVNGMPIKLTGYGRHDTHAHFGHALSGMQRSQDIALSATMGSTFMRIGHYPQDRSMQSLADEAGMLNWVEMMGWDSSPSTYTNPAWIAAGITGLEEMVNDTFNHPSTIMYAFINEGDSSNATNCPTYTLFNARYKALEVQGLTSYASDRGAGDVCYAASGVDVLGFNLYPGWYAASGDPDGVADIASVATTLDTLATWAQATVPGKPILVTEIGAGAIPGWDDAMHGYWTATYQAQILNAAARSAVYDDRWSGVALWQMFDQRTYSFGTGSLGRPRGFNNKGTFDENRKPKLAAYTVVYNAFHGLPQPDWLNATLP